MEVEREGEERLCSISFVSNIRSTSCYNYSNYHNTLSSIAQTTYLTTKNLRSTEAIMLQL